MVLDIILRSLPKTISIVLVVVLFFVTGCSKTSLEYPTSRTENGKLNVSSNLDVDIYLDATLSMQGFVQPDNSSNYAQTLRILEHAVVGVWPKSNISFNKFGTIIAPMKRQEYLKAETPSFYDSEINRDTNILRVIEQASKDKLTVIVTDLFEKDSDIVAISSELVKSYTAVDKSVGILAVRSEYCGTVYDVGIQAKSFQYCTASNDLGKQRPFYLLILGKYADVAKYAESLRESHKTLAQAQFLIIQKQLVKDEGRLQKTISLDKLVEVSNILPAANSKEQTMVADRIKQFEIRNGKEKVSSTFPVFFERLPYVMPFDDTLMDLQVVSAQQFTEKRGGYKILWKKILEEVPMPKEAYSAISMKIQPDMGAMSSSRKITMDVNTTLLDVHSINRFDVVLRPNEASFVMPEWVDNWDMTPSTVDGSKTINLKLFVSGIWRGTLQAQRSEIGPRVATIYVYIKRDK